MGIPKHLKRRKGLCGKEKEEVTGCCNDLIPKNTNFKYSETHDNLHVPIY